MKGLIKQCFLTKAILSKKIPIECSQEYRYILNKIIKKKMHSNDAKIALCDDYCLTGIFAKAVKLIEKIKKMSRVNKLQLVDAGKLNAVLELIKKDIETKKC